MYGVILQAQEILYIKLAPRSYFIQGLDRYGCQLQILMEASEVQVEAELTELDPEERLDYLKSIGVSEGGLGSLVRATYNLLGLRTYFTSGEKVVPT